MAAQDDLDLERFLALTLDLLCVTDAAGTFVHVNDAWQRTLGWSPAELVGRPIADLLHPDDSDATAAAMARMAAGERFVDFGNRYRHRSGEWRRLLWTAWGDQRTGLLYGTARDVTDARRAEQERHDVHAAVLAVSAATDREDAAAVLAEQLRRLTGAVGVTVTAAPAVEHEWGGTASQVHRASAGEPPDDGERPAEPPPDGEPAPGPETLDLVARDGTTVARVAIRLPADLPAAERRRRMGLAREVVPSAAVVLERTRAEVAARVALDHRLQLLDSVADAFYALDREWRFSFVNSAAERLLRRTAGELLGRSVIETFPGFDRTPFARRYRQALETGRPVAFTEYYPPLARWFDVRAHPSAGGLAVYFMDVTDAHLAARALERRAEQQRAVADLGRRAVSGAGPRVLAETTVAEALRVLRSAVVGVCELRDDGAVVELHAVGGTSAARLPGRTIPVRSLSGTALAGTLASGVATVVPRIPRPGEGGLTPDLSIGLRSDAAVPIVVAGATWGAVFAASTVPDAFPTDDVVFLQQLAHLLGAALEQRETENRLRHQAEHDSLTRLPNRVVLRREVDAAVAAALQQDHLAALLLLDLDGFKDVNDSLGHLAGDRLLSTLGGRLLDVVGEGGTIARLGGDEFAVCVPGPVAPAGLDRLADAVLAAVAEPVRLSGLDVAVSASMGAVLAPTHGTDASTLLRHADVAMYRAKRTSRRHWVLYDPAVDSAPAERLATITELRAGTRGGQLELHYQPVIDMVTRSPVSLEALVRWRHPARGLVPPAEFIPLAEQTGLIGELTLDVVHQAADQARRWRHRGLRLPVAVNVSVVSLSDAQQADALVAALAAAADVLSVEVTESALVERGARASLQRLAAAGVACAVDDFGTGYSALSYLRSLPVSTLKIDREFVADVQDDDVDLAIIRSVVDLARTLDLDVIAEGVESEAVAARLTDVGVRHAQGYHYARPASAAAVQEWLTTHPPGPARQRDDGDRAP